MDNDDTEITPKDVECTVKLTLSIIKSSLTNPNVTWMYNASGEMPKIYINLFY